MTAPSRLARSHAGRLLLLACLAGLPWAGWASGPDNSLPRPHASLLPLVQPLWSQLTDAEREVLGPFESQWNAWSIDEKRAWVVVADRFAKMNPGQREAVSARIRDWAQLSPEQRRIARQNFRLAHSLPREERDEEVRRFQALTPEQKQVLESNGSTSNTAARHAGSRTGLAKQASQPLSDLVARPAVDRH